MGLTHRPRPVEGEADATGADGGASEPFGHDRADIVGGGHLECGEAGVDGDGALGLHRIARQDPLPHVVETEYLDSGAGGEIGVGGTVGLMDHEIGTAVGRGSHVREHASHGRLGLPQHTQHRRDPPPVPALACKDRLEAPGIVQYPVRPVVQRREAHAVLLDEGAECRRRCQHWFVTCGE